MHGGEGVAEGEPILMLKDGPYTIGVEKLSDILRSLLPLSETERLEIIQRLNEEYS